MNDGGPITGRRNRTETGKLKAILLTLIEQQLIGRLSLIDRSAIVQAALRSIPDVSFEPPRRRT